MQKIIIKAAHICIYGDERNAKFQSQEHDSVVIKHILSNENRCYKYATYSGWKERKGD